LRGAEYRDVKLPLLDLVYKFYTSERDGRVIEPLETKHWSHSLFHRARVLFNEVVEIAIRPHDEIGWQPVLFLSRRDRFVGGGIAI
jgi:hypothetical protein